MSQGNLAAVLIFGIVFATACVAILMLKTKPARIAAVIVALATLVSALVPLTKLLTQEPRPTQVVAPVVPGATAAAPSVTGLAQAGPTSSAAEATSVAPDPAQPAGADTMKTSSATTNPSSPPVRQVEEGK